MPPRPQHTTSRITSELVRRYFNKLSSKNPYFVYEDGRSAIHGCALRVHRTKIEIGVRASDGRRWEPIADLRPDVDLETLEAYRAQARKVSRHLEDTKDEPAIVEGRRMTLGQLWQAHRTFLLTRRHSRRSPRTIEHRDYLWDSHLLPLYGDLTLRQFAALPPAELAQIPDLIRARVTASRPWSEGLHTANHGLNYLRMTWEFARKRGWALKDPLLEVELLDAPSAHVYLEDSDLAAIGQALRALEARAAESSSTSRHQPALGSLLAVRIVLYTGARHREELLRGKLSWLRQDFGLPRLEVPRAKGDRGDRQGRVLYLGPHGLECLLRIPRPDGCDDLVPGRIPGTQMFRLNETWERVLLDARLILRGRSDEAPSAILRARLSGDPPVQGEIRIPVKATRHTVKTVHPRAGVSPEHSRQLLGHEAADLGDRVYLHRHGPSLSAAAEKTEAFIRQLLGDGLSWCSGG